MPRPSSEAQSLDALSSSCLGQAAGRKRSRPGRPARPPARAEQGPEAIIQQVRAAEGSDPDGKRWPRGKRHDDASAACCHLT